MRIFGHIEGIEVGTTFENRKTLSASRIHRPLQSGICGGKDGAESIVVSGGYVDDEDSWTEIIYTGHGGNDPATKRQISDQDLRAPGNAGLVRSQLDQLPVRVVRGSRDTSPYAPASGFRYDGLYQVDEHWIDIGTDGYEICRFRLTALETIEPPVAADPHVVRRRVTVNRRVRDPLVAQRVKELHEWICQVCGETVATDGGRYAEAAHIRPVGRPHDGPDTLDNLLCLCPNDHVRFDNGALAITSSYQVIDCLTGSAIGPLRRHPRHPVSLDHATYHRSLASRPT